MARIEIDTNADSPAVLKTLGATILEMAHEFEREGLAKTPGKSVEQFDKTVETLEPPKGAVEKELARPGDTDTDEETLGNDSAGQETVTPGAGAAQDAQRDLNGVEFDGAFCSRAKDPHYATGKRKGQWKKRKGVTDEQYDAWYDGQLNAGDNREFLDDLAGAGDDIDVSTAFGAASKAQKVAERDFTGVGEFMAWTSEKVAAQLLTQEDIGGAYNQLGLEAMALFQLAGAEQLEVIHSLYDILAVKAGA